MINFCRRYIKLSIKIILKFLGISKIQIIKTVGTKDAKNIINTLILYLYLMDFFSYSLFLIAL